MKSCFHRNVETIINANSWSAAARLFCSILIYSSGTLLPSLLQCHGDGLSLGVRPCSWSMTVCKQNMQPELQLKQKEKPSAAAEKAASAARAKNCIFFSCRSGARNEGGTRWHKSICLFNFVTFHYTWNGRAHDRKKKRHIAACGARWRRGERRRWERRAYPGRDAQRGGWVHIPHGWHVQTRQLSIRWTGVSERGGRVGVRPGLDSFSIWQVAPSHISQSSEWWRCGGPSKKKKKKLRNHRMHPPQKLHGRLETYFNSTIQLGWSKGGGSN